MFFSKTKKKKKGLLCSSLSLFAVQVIQVINPLYFSALVGRSVSAVTMSFGRSFRCFSVADKPPLNSLSRKKKFSASSTSTVYSVQRYGTAPVILLVWYSCVTTHYHYQDCTTDAPTSKSYRDVSSRSHGGSGTTTLQTGNTVS